MLRPKNETIFVPIKDQTVEKMGLAFGITKEREDELDKLIDDCYDKTENYADCISEISKECNDASELAYCCLFLGMFVENQRGKAKRIEALAGLLTSIAGDK